MKHFLFAAAMLYTGQAVAQNNIVKDIYPYSVNTGESISNIIDLNGTAYFTANSPQMGQELFKSDGTRQGTGVVKNIWTNSGGAISYGGLTKMGSNIFFTAYDGYDATELWKSNGTLAGTQLVVDLYGITRSVPQNITAIGSTLYFSATDNATNGRDI